MDQGPRRRDAGLSGDLPADLARLRDDPQQTYGGIGSGTGRTGEHIGQVAPYGQQAGYGHQQQASGPPQAYGQGYGPQQYFQAQQAPSNGMGVAGFILGLLGLVFFWFPFLGLILAVLGVILGGVGMSNGRKSGAGTGLAIAGLVLGLIALVPVIIVLVSASSLY